MADRPQPTIIMTPPTNTANEGHSHPRRPPAHRSVSLLHSPRRRQVVPPKDRSDSSSSESNAASKEPDSGKSDSPSSLQPHGRASSGESSNAEKWFDKSNNDVRDNSATFADNDPPFFMRNSSSSETPPDVQQQIQRYLTADNGVAALPLRTNLLQLGTDGSSTEDYRGVIDDLTIENKKLKRRLKKYEKLHDSHLRDEKLFEVRIHGLPPDKKRELEDTLRKFASSLGTSGFPANGYGGLLPALNKQNTASSQTSLHNTDSAYASMSASGQGSSGQSGSETRYRQFPSTAASRRQNIHSYLHHIPEGLLPQQSPTNMTERAKKKLVVRRLEQIFAGKGAALQGHQQSLQQQDVSQMAAHADKIASEAQGLQARQEGTREAQIMKQEMEESTENQGRAGTGSSRDVKTAVREQEQPSQPSGLPKAQSADFKGAEQRPTRPLDLDPHRAQVPADNLRYIRHLGFSPLDAESSQALQEGHGWIYLNLLINMAQLHTIHVTSEFVRKAISEYSSKFEVSHDGRKVRWKGGRSVTRTSSSGEGSSHSRVTTDTPDGQSPRKRPKLTHRESGRSGISQTQDNKLMYTPLFFHKDSTDDAEDSSDDGDDTGSSPFPAPVAGDSSGMTSSGFRTISTRKSKKRDDGPIIFYNNARFCTDLSGDRKSDGDVNAPLYTPVAAVPVGRPQRVSSGIADEKRGPLANATELPEPMDLVDNPIPESLELSFPPRTPLQSKGKAPQRPIDMEVTGIGGVWPADNFAISVESRHARLDQDQDQDQAPIVTQEGRSRLVPPKLAHILENSGARRKALPAVHKHIVSARKQDLPPSDLPPALSFMPSEDSYDDEEEDDDSMSISPDSPGAMPPSTAPQPVELHYSSSDEVEEESDDSDAESDGSLDLLAAAREVDPEAIREQEREYDANMAERLAEEIPAGSSAATAGGGSGFASPASGVDKVEYRKAMKEARQRPADLKRAQTSDSMKVQNPQEESSSDEDEDEDEEMSDVAS